MVGLLARWNERDQLLRSSHADPRHASLGAVLQTSWKLLSAPERSVYSQLSVFEDGARPDVINAVVHLAEGGDVGPVLRALRRRSLLVARPTAGLPGQPRLLMYAHVRHHAASKLDPEIAAACRDRLWSWAASLGTRASLDRADRRGGHALVRAWAGEHGTLEGVFRDTIAASDPRAAGVALALTRVLDLTSPLSAMKRVCAEALPLAAELWQRVELTRRIAHVQTRSNEVQAALQALHQLLEVEDLEPVDRGRVGFEIGMVQGMTARFAESLDTYAWAVLEQAPIERARLDRSTVSTALSLGRHSVADEALIRCAETLEAEGGALDLAWLASYRAEVEATRGAMRSSIVAFAEAQRHFERAQHLPGVALTQQFQGYIHLCVGDLHQAERKLRAAAEVGRRVGYLPRVVESMAWLGYAQALDGEIEARGALVQEALEAAEGASRHVQGIVRTIFADVVHLQGRIWDAVEVREQAQERVEPGSLEYFGNRVLMAGLLAEAGDIDRALPMAREAVWNLAGLDRYSFSYTLAVFGAVALACGDVPQARHALTEAEVMAAPLQLGPQSPAERALEKLREGLSTAA